MLPAQALRSLSEPSTTVLGLPPPQCTSLPTLHHSCTTLLLDMPLFPTPTSFLWCLSLSCFLCPARHIFRTLHILSQMAPRSWSNLRFLSMAVLPSLSFPFLLGGPLIGTLSQRSLFLVLSQALSYRWSLSEPLAYGSYSTWPNASRSSPQWWLIGCHSTLRKH